MSTIGITADITQTYLQISVASSDIKYCFTRVVFGASPSKLVWKGVMKLHLEKYKEIDPLFPIKQFLYRGFEYLCGDL